MLHQLTFLSIRYDTSSTRVDVWIGITNHRLLHISLLFCPGARVLRLLGPSPPFFIQLLVLGL